MVLRPIAKVLRASTINLFWPESTKTFRLTRINQKIQVMTLDKIRIAIGDHLWNFWQNQHDIGAISRAEKDLKHEIEIGIRRRYQDFAEYELLCKKLGKDADLDLRSKKLVE